MASEKRLGYFDFLRGVAILLVIAIHTCALGGFETPMEVARMWGKQSAMFAVPVFLAISGFFLARKPLDTAPRRLDFWRRQVSKIYVPCLVWSVPWLLLGWLETDALTWPVVWKGLIRFFLCGYSVYYFIALIIQCYVLLPWLTHVKSGGVIGFALMSFASVAVVNWYLNIGGHELPMVVYAGLFPVYGFFFVLGVWLSRRPRTYRLFPLLVLLLLSLVLSMWETEWQMSFHGKGHGIKPSVFLYSTLAVFILFSRRLQDAYTGRSQLAKAVQWVGEVSFGVYLVHMYFVPVAAKLVPTDAWVVNWSVATVLTLVFIAVVKRVAPRAVARWLGFR